jgi:hypothetical protein
MSLLIHSLSSRNHLSTWFPNFYLTLTCSELYNKCDNFCKVFLGPSFAQLWRSILGFSVVYQKENNLIITGPVYLGNTGTTVRFALPDIKLTNSMELRPS